MLQTDQERGLQRLDSESESLSHHLLNYLISLGFHYLVHKMGMKAVMTSQHCEESTM